MSSVDDLSHEMGIAIWGFVISIKNGIIRTAEDFGPLSPLSLIEPDLAWSAAQTHYQQNIRVVKLFKETIGNRNKIINSIKTIIEFEIRRMDPHKYASLEEKFQKYGVRYATKYELQKIIINKITAAILSDVSVSAAITKISYISVSFGVNIVAFQGLLQEAGAASERLKEQDPALWHRLSINGSDMLYFIFEKQLQHMISSKELDK